MSLLSEDRDLLQRFREGESAALEAVFRHYASEVNTTVSRGFVFESEGRTLRFEGFEDPGDAMNLVHEVFRRAFEPRAREAYDGLRPYGPWLRRIARNTVISELRQQGRLVSLEEAGGGEERGGDPLDRMHAEAQRGAGLVHGEVPEAADAGLARRDLRRGVRAFLDALPERARQLLHLRYEESLSQTEAGQRLGMSRMSVRTQEKHLRRALFEHLEGAGLLDELETGP